MRDSPDLPIALSLIRRRCPEHVSCSRCADNALTVQAVLDPLVLGGVAHSLLGQAYAQRTGRSCPYNT